MRRLAFALLISAIPIGNASAFDLPQVDWGAMSDQALSMGNAAATATVDATIGAYEGASAIAVDVGSGAGAVANDLWQQGYGLADQGWRGIGGPEGLDQARMLAVAGWEVYASDPVYWHDLVIVAGVTGVAGAGANVTCASLTSGAGPLVMAGVGGACGAAGVHYASEAVPYLYGLVGWKVDPEAQAAARDMAMTVGVLGTSLVMAVGGGHDGAQFVPAMKTGMAIDDWIGRYYAPKKQDGGSAVRP